MPRFGAHMSRAGGIWRVFDRAEELNADSLQLFTKSNRRWDATELTDEDVEKFESRWTETGIEDVIVHSAYLINLASPKEGVWERSVNGLTIELERCDRLGIPWLVVHPGAHTGSGVDAGIDRVVEAIDKIYDERDFTTRLALENTAGQGTSLGANFSQLAAIIDGLDQPERIGICVDTCHALCAGYETRTEQGYAQTLEDLDDAVGLERVVAFHVNDSQNELGSNVDRHAHIGRGYCGLETFRHLVNDARFSEHPMILETPKDDDMTEDRINLRVLRALVDGSAESVDEDVLEEWWEGVEVD